ncbi:hypothetical protein [Bacillus sp. AFS017336]|uniref:WD40/YVTN/BNR-like repeat-containing protein n=1 Tax=Bacillus sp. AFS017336 TaxID=2033489 RepID=UPI000BF1EF13|nr:hypothetical protein [Bacillus sp. AFS017336]PEL09892.1 hypothetical protein CN601_15240 [Bacillus sp. AFS017336]
MNNMFSSTAVTRTENGSTIIATVNNGIIIDNDGNRTFSFPTIKNQIRDLKCVGRTIYGVGDNGIFIKSINEGKDWNIEQFPTKASVWSVCCNAKGLVVAHGDKVIYISTNYGETWKIISPFKVNKPPSIRSLCLHGNTLFIGTKIHPINGGIWMLDLGTFKITRVKTESDKMISSMLVNKDLLITVSGSCRGRNGVVEYSSIKSLYAENGRWDQCHSTINNGSYLDICAHNGIVYTSSSQNDSGYSTVSRVYLESQLIVPCDYVKGHGWRICNENENYIVAGQYETRFFEKDSKRVC